jgi:hypothetical protein
VSAATRFIAAFAAALGLAISGAGVSAARSSVDSTWYWSEYGAAHALYLNGITWRSGVDRMRQTHCWGLGHWLVEADGTRLFSHFYCTASPTSGSQYDVIVNVTGSSLYAVSFASYVKPQTWYWTSQYTANALFKNGIRWAGTVDPVSSDACSPFGPHMPSDGSYFQHFYCLVHTRARSPYTVVVNVTDKLLYQVKWVDFDDQYPATPAQPRPSVATAASSASGGGGASTSVPPVNSTPSCANDIFCNVVNYVETAPSSTSHSWIDDALVNSALSESAKRAIRSAWGNDRVPNGADTWTDQVGCRNHAYPQMTAFSSVTAC